MQGEGAVFWTTGDHGPLRYCNSQSYTDLCTSMIPHYTPECKAYVTTQRCLAQTCDVHLELGQIEVE